MRIKKVITLAFLFVALFLGAFLSVGAVDNAFAEGLFIFRDGTEVKADLGVTV